MELKTFLAHRHCQSLMDLRWRGGFPDSAVVLSPTHTLWQVFMWAFVVPFANPYLVRPDPAASAALVRKKKRSASGVTNREEDEEYAVDKEDLVLGALAEAMALRRYEKQHAVASLEKQNKEIEEAAAAEEAAANAARKAARAAEVTEQRNQGGATVLAADAEGRLDLKKAAKVGPSAMKKACIALSATQGGGNGNGEPLSLAQLSLKHSKPKFRSSKYLMSGVSSPGGKGGGGGSPDSSMSFVKRSFGKSTRYPRRGAQNPRASRTRCPKEL